MRFKNSNIATSIPLGELISILSRVIILNIASGIYITCIYTLSALSTCQLSSVHMKLWQLLIGNIAIILSAVVKTRLTENQDQKFQLKATGLMVLTLLVRIIGYSEMMIIYQLYLYILVNNILVFPHGNFNNYFITQYIFF